jgi:hypothetical protein
VSAYNTQRVTDLDMHLVHIRALFIYLLAKVCRDVLVEFLLNKLRNSCFDGPVDLRLDLTGVKNQYCKHIKRTLLTLPVEVLQHLIVQCILQESCQKNSDLHPLHYAALTFDFFLFIGLR